VAHLISVEQEPHKGACMVVGIFDVNCEDKASGEPLGRIIARNGQEMLEERAVQDSATSGSVAESYTSSMSIAR